MIWLVLTYKSWYTISVRNELDTLQETSKRPTPNKEHNFVTAHIGAAAEWISTNPWVKRRVLWESKIEENEIRRKNILIE